MRGELKIAANSYTPLIAKAPVWTKSNRGLFLKLTGII